MKKKKEKAFVLCKWATLLWSLVASNFKLKKQAFPKWGMCKTWYKCDGLLRGSYRSQGGMEGWAWRICTMSLAWWKRQKPKIKGWRDGMLGKLGDRSFHFFNSTFYQVAACAKPSSGTWVFAEKDTWQKESLEFDIMETWISITVLSHITS